MTSVFDILQWMDDATANAFNAGLYRRRYHAGQVIYIQGDRGDEMFRLVSGSVRMSVVGVDGREVIFTFFEPGDCFGDSSLLDGDPRPQGTTALTDVEVDVIDLPHFQRLRAEQPGFDTALLKLLARQMRVVSDRFAASGLGDLRSRVAARIADAARSLGKVDEGGGVLLLRLPQSDLAAMVGASRQSVNRALQQFQAEQLIDIEYGSLLIKDLPGLERLVQPN